MGAFLASRRYVDRLHGEARRHEADPRRPAADGAVDAASRRATRRSTARPSRAAASSRSSPRAAARRRSTSRTRAASARPPFDTTPPATAVHRHPRSRLVARRNEARLRRRPRRRHDRDRHRRRHDADVNCPRGAQPVWSPSGTRIAFASNDDLMSVALDGTDVRTLGFGTPLDWRVVPIGTPKFPNLVQRPPSELVIEHRGDGHWLLGFTSMVDNRGPGILWIRAARAPGQHVMVVHQLIQLAGGGRRVDAPSGELKYVNAPPHHHWHFLGFDHYELRSVVRLQADRARLQERLLHRRPLGHAIGVPHGPPRFLGDCAQFHPEARAVEEGSSVGYTDRYPGVLPRPAARHHEGAGGPLLARPPRERGLPPARVELRGRHGVDPDPLHLARRERRASRRSAPVCASAASSRPCPRSGRSARARAGTRPG